MKDKRGILVAGFGTAYPDSRKRTIELLEQEIAAAHPETVVARAWASGRLRELVKSREGLLVDGIGEALRRMAQKGVTRVAVQPVCVIAGLEYDLIRKEAGMCREMFTQLLVGRPLLLGEADCEPVARLAMENCRMPGRGEALVWFGHGTSHGANPIYRRLDQAFLRQDGAERVRLATVKAEPDLEEILKWLGEREIRRVHLAPFMLTAGGHVCREMAGENEDSWRMRLIRAGYEAECHMQGLGENAGIRRMYLEYVCQTLEALD